MNQTTARLTAFRSRVPTILLKLLALGWFFGAVVCLSEVLEHTAMGRLDEAALESLVYLPLAAVPAVVGFGLRRGRRWGRTAALAIGLPAVLIVTIAVAFCLVVSFVDAGGQWANNSFGVALLLIIAGPPAVVGAAAQAYLLTCPSLRALFESQASRAALSWSALFVAAVVGIAMLLVWWYLLFGGGLDLRWH